MRVACLRQAGRTWQILLVCSALVVGVAEAVYPSPVVLDADDPLVGVWTNPEYERTGETTAKWEFFMNGKELDYFGIADEIPRYECMNTIEAKWVDVGGVRWYKIRTVFWVYCTGSERTEALLLARIDASGTKLESVLGYLEYPEEIGELGSRYRAYYKAQ